MTVSTHVLCSVAKLATLKKADSKNNQSVQTDKQATLFI